MLVKPAGGGGGIGMLPAKDEGELLAVVERSRSMASRGFGNAEVYLERLFERPRHVEFQVLGDQHGNAAHLFERDCSVQRRNQKVIEEAPGPALDAPKSTAVADQIAAIIKEMGYDNIGTVEMLMAADGSFNFLEMNTRLQVEHGVTEEVTGVDLVQAQIRSAAGEKLSAIFCQTKSRSRTCACRRACMPKTRRIFFRRPASSTVFRPPEDKSIRIETGYAEGRDVTPFYDPMIAKVIVHAASRELAIEQARRKRSSIRYQRPEDQHPDGDCNAAF